METPWHLGVMSSLYFLAGLLHLYFPQVYLRIMPPYLPAPRFLVYASGIAELILAVGLLFEKTRTLSVLAIATMLILYLPVHFHMLYSPKAGGRLPKWVLIARIPLQFALFYWTLTYL